MLNDNNSKSFLTYELESTLAKLFEEELILIDQISKILDEFYNDPEFKIYSIIRELDLEFKNYIDEIDIETYLNQNELNYSRLDCKLILFRLDRDLDSRINYHQLKFLFKTNINEIKNTNNFKNISSNSQNKKHLNKNFSSIDFINQNNYEYKMKTYDEIELDYKNKNNKIQLKYNNHQNSINYTLANFIEDFLISQIKLEQIKIKMAISNDIIINELFYLFDDFNKKNLIDKFSFKKTLNKFLIYPTDEEINLIFRRYDTDKDYNLDYEEFYNIFIPFSKQHQKLMKNKIENLNNKNKISFESKTILINFFKVLIDNEVIIEINRKLLCDKNEFSAYEEFINIKSLYDNKSDFESFYNFIEDNKIKANLEEINLIFNIFDKDKDSRISFNEFIQEITPKNLIDE